MVNLTSETAFAAVLTAGSIAANVYPGLNDADLTPPYVVCECRGADEFPPFTGNHNCQMEVSVVSPAIGDSPAATHKALVGDVVNILATGTLAQALSAAVPNYHAFGVHSFSFAPTTFDSDNRRWQTSIGCMVYACPKTLA